VVLVAGLSIIGINAFIVMGIMARRLQTALQTAEGEKKQLESRNSQLNALYAVFSEITTTMSLRYVVNAAVREAVALMNANLSVLRLVKGDQLVVAGSQTEDGSEIPDLGPSPLDFGPNGRAARHGRTVRIERGARDMLIDAPEEARRRAESGIITPLIVGARVVGTLACWSIRPEAFTAEDERILEMMASQVAAAVVAADSTETSERRALRDALTGLSNRLQLSNDVADFSSRVTLDGQRHAAVAMADIDHFKRFNDEFGHRVGDVTLQKVASVIANVVRDTDRVYRYGGEEFVIVFMDADGATARTLAERVRSAVETAPLTGDEMAPIGPVTVSIGVALYPDHARDLNMLIELADAAMYQAKDAGRNRVVVWSGSREEVAA
jgi:diguanylate cyclase (GGDEF)-like protein